MSTWEITDPRFEADQVNEKLRIAPWEGHRNFAYDLVSYLKPKCIIELGSHYGCSLFAFAQSIKDNGLDSTLIAVDTWGGDEQAGFYGEEVFTTVSDTISRYYSGVNIRLNRNTFDEALDDIENESVDIIHIDGLHTYEAVSHDYQTWLPKLRPDGIILFHDVYSLLGYGSDQFWQEIKIIYPNFELKHSWGLGILFPNGDNVYKQLKGENLEDKLKMYQYKAMFEMELIKNNDLSLMVTERDRSIASNEFMIEERDKTIKQNDNMILVRDNVIRQNEYLIKERDETIQQNEYMIKERDKTIQQNEIMIKERDKTIQQNEIMIRERDKTIQQNEIMIKERDETIQQNEIMIKERDKAIESNEKMIQERDNIISKFEASIQDKDISYSALEDRLIQANQSIHDLETELGNFKSKKIIVNFNKK